MEDINNLCSRVPETRHDLYPTVRINNDYNWLNFCHKKGYIFQCSNLAVCIFYYIKYSI